MILKLKLKNKSSNYTFICHGFLPRQWLSKQVGGCGGYKLVVVVVTSWLQVGGCDLGEAVHHHSGPQVIRQSGEGLQVLGVLLGVVGRRGNGQECHRSAFAVKGMK